MVTRTNWKALLADPVARPAFGRYSLMEARLKPSADAVIVADLPGYCVVDLHAQELVFAGRDATSVMARWEGLVLAEVARLRTEATA